MSGKTVCPFCGCGCGILIENGASFPLLYHEAARGALCLRGWSSSDLLLSAKRLNNALVKTDNSISAVPIETAIAELAKRLSSLREQYGREAIGVMGSARLTCEESRLLLRLASSVLKTPHIDSSHRLGYMPLPPFPADKSNGKQQVLVVGSDLAQRHPQIARWVLQSLRDGSNVHILDSRSVQLSSLASSQVQPLIGEEVNALKELGNRLGEAFVIVSSDLALMGMGSRLMDALEGMGQKWESTFLTDYVNQLGMIQAGFSPQNGGWSFFEMLMAAKAGKLKGLLIVGDNPFELFPEMAAEAFENLELVAVIDAFQTEAVRRAHIAIPGALLCEKEGTVVNLNAKEQPIAPVVPPRNGLTDGEILRRLIGLLEGTLPSQSENEKLKAQSVLSDEMEPAEEHPSSDFPFMLGMDAGFFWSKDTWCQFTIKAGREVRLPFADFPDGFAIINPQDAREVGIRPFSVMHLESKDGSIRLTAKLDARARKGCVLVPIFLWERVGKAVGALKFDKEMQYPIFQPKAVRVYKEA